jgi:hypothetical protein
VFIGSAYGVSVVEMAEKDSSLSDHVLTDSRQGSRGEPLQPP